ncbi:MAG TPA: 5'-3' exonuclease [Mycobacteriales bacterium]|jgi:5'-3' exonuclease|nr:5'-3' exonuclease [Mycobacteriales bacterium]
MLLDSASLWFRAYHGVPSTVVSPDGRPVNAVRGFLDHIARLLREHQPGGLVACLDEDWRPAFRVAAVPSYKTHRLVQASGTDTPDDLAPQVEIILDVLRAMGFATAGAPGFEADDVIGTLAAASAGEVDVVSGDRDLFQVIRPGVRVLYTVERGRPYDDAAVAARYGIPNGQAYADFALLRGDPSDGLPGVAGVGEKTAATLVRRYGGVDQILAALDAGDAVPAAAKLLHARDYLVAAKAVVRVATDVPLPSMDAAIPAAPTQPERLLSLVDRWGLSSPVERLLGALATLQRPISGG